VSQMFRVLEKNAEVLSRRRFVKSLVGVCAATVAWAAGAREAFAGCPTIGTNQFGHCPNSCPSGLYHVACCCLATNNYRATCCSCNSWAWYCTCNGQDFECFECNDPSCPSSDAEFLGTAPVAAAS